MFKVGDRVVERGGETRVYKVCSIVGESMFIKDMETDKEHCVTMERFAKTNKEPVILVRCFGHEHLNNVLGVLEKADIVYKYRPEDYRGDVAKIFVDKKVLETAQQALEDFYKTT